MSESEKEAKSVALGASPVSLTLPSFCSQCGNKLSEKKSSQAFSGKLLIKSTKTTTLSESITFSRCWVTYVLVRDTITDYNSTLNIELFLLLINADTVKKKSHVQ